MEKSFLNIFPNWAASFQRVVPDVDGGVGEAFEDTVVKGDSTTEYVDGRCTLSRVSNLELYVPKARRK